MKPFIDPDLRPIDPPLFNDSSELYLHKDDIPSDSFESENLDSNAKNVHNSTTKSTLAQPQFNTQPVTINNKTVFNAEKILQCQKRQGKNQYLTKWFGYPQSQSSLEPEENIFGQTFE